MKKYSSDKDINELVRRLLKCGWTVRNGKKHPLVISPAGGRLPIPSTPSDRRSFYNFSSDIKKIDARQGAFCG